METTVVIDGREVKLKATAAIPRLYRIKFRRDIIQDLQTVQKGLEGVQNKEIQHIPLEALTLFENIAYIMAKHADGDAVPNNQDEWMDSFSVFSIYNIFPVILALWQANTEALDIAKKKLEKSNGT